MLGEAVKPELFFSHRCATVKSRYIGDGHPTFNRNPYNGYINPYYWVDDHPLLYGNNGSLDPGTDEDYPTCLKHLLHRRMLGAESPLIVIVLVWWDVGKRLQERCHSIKLRLEKEESHWSWNWEIYAHILANNRDSSTSFGCVLLMVEKFCPTDLEDRKNNSWRQMFVGSEKA